MENQGKIQKTIHSLITFLESPNREKNNNNLRVHTSDDKVLDTYWTQENGISNKTGGGTY